MSEVAAKVRAQLESRGAKTIRGLGRTFKQIDWDGNKMLSRDEFSTGLNELGCDLTPEELDELFKVCDTNQDGNVDFNEFLKGVRGELNQQRQAVVDAAFSIFDVDGTGVVNAQDLKQVYRCNLHPQVISGEITEDEAFVEFLASFGDKNNDGNISKGEWDNYYAAVSSSVDNDDEFCLMMANAWNL